MQNLQTLNEVIDKLIAIRDSMLASEKPDFVVNQKASPEHKIQSISDVVVNTSSSDFDKLRTLLAGDDWPVAVNPVLICNTSDSTEKCDRAQGIIDLMVEEDLAGKRFLDFGTGLGYVPYVAIGENPLWSVGYDIVANEEWANFEQKPNLVLTTEYDKLKEYGPFDVILLFDVIDHAEDPLRTLQQVYELLSDNGKVYLRAHPWMSRHATHAYYELNKAYIHLIFNDQELSQILTKPERVNKIVKPLATYTKLFDDTGFRQEDARPLKVDPELFFQTPIIANRIIKNTGHKEFPKFQMSMEWIDYILKKN